MDTVNNLIQEIEKLPPLDRARIIDIVIRDITSPDPEIDKVWAQEALIRWDSYKKGSVKPVSYEEAMRKYSRGS